MKTVFIAVALLALSLSTITVRSQDGVVLRKSGTTAQLSWPAAIIRPEQARLYPDFMVEQSSDLEHWSPFGHGRVRGFPGRAESLSLQFDAADSARFFRVLVDENAPDQAPMLADGGADVLGYNSQFARELKQTRLLSLDDFKSRNPQPAYLPALTWDVTTAQFWTDLNARFSLNALEQEMLRTNGFVVSEAKSTQTFGWGYYQLFTSDLPVFVTADSVLHAWHKSYQTMLVELEQRAMAPAVSNLLVALSSRLPGVWATYGDGVLRDSILDTDFFLTVGRSLSAGQEVPTALNNPEVAERVRGALAAVESRSFERIKIFGATQREVDFSQFTVRGHYTTSELLRRYFKTVMWCGRIDLRLATFEPNKEDDIPQLGGAVVLMELLNQSGVLNLWQGLDEITRTFIGITDSMTFPQLQELLTAAGISSCADVPDLLTLTNLQTRLLTGELGLQSIDSDFFRAVPLALNQVRLPRSFTLLGQKFVLDSWVFSQTVYDRVERRKPSCLDVAYAVLGNDQIAPELVARMQDRNGVPFRDGMPYHPNLLAVRNVVDQQQPAIWTNNIYLASLGALRALSAPTTGSEYPEAMRTRAWAMKSLQTQIASWTELRHDTVLYVKQSYTDPVLCSYPYGYVEPRPEFWKKMRILAETTAASYGKLSFVPNAVYFLKYFSTKMSELGAIAEKELAQLPLTTSEIELLQNVVEIAVDYVGVPYWTGWYPGLFYETTYGEPPACNTYDALVTDVHTDLPDEIQGDPGAVIHEGVGDVNLLIMAVDNGPDRMVYAGPVFSHYEFEMPLGTRLTDEEWQALLESAHKPAPPEWTRSFLVPK